MKRLLALLGREVSHSLSPKLHAAAAEALGLDLVYVPVSARDAGHFERSVAALRQLGALGANVTIPYKIDALRLSERVSETARAIGAVNLLSFDLPDGTGIAGDNTDGPALLELLGRLTADTRARTQILGAGGAARAAAWALGKLGVESLTISARDPAQAGEVAKLVPGAVAGPLARRAEATLIVSALPGTDALAHQILEAWVDRTAQPVIADLAYGLPASPLVRLARDAGLTASDGLEMLIEQAALSLRSWTGGDLSRIRAAMHASARL